jgi:ABC-type multidrug transport system ATPase subunit
LGQGEVFGFLGPNGAGKTTTLKLLMQLIFPSSGRAEILGRPVGDVGVKRLIGYLPENPYFYDYLTAEDCSSISAGCSGTSRRSGAGAPRHSSTRWGSAAERRLHCGSFERHVAARRHRAGPPQ